LSLNHQKENKSMTTEPDAVQPVAGKSTKRRAQLNTYVPPASPRLPVDCLRNIPLLVTFVVASTATCIGMMASTKLEQPFSVAAPFIAIYFVAYLVPVAPSWLSCSIFPLVTVYSALYINNAQIAVALVSQAGVAAVRTFAMAYYPALQGNFGARCCILQMICIFEGAVPRTDTLGALAKKWVPSISIYGGTAFGLHRAAIFLLGREFLKDSVFIAGGIMGLIAMLVLQVLDGVYNLCF
ncbi:transmembrane protein, putative, partial [Bodo saltans]